MFATLLGGLPRPPDSGDEPARLEAAVRAQETAGLEPITDGRGATGEAIGVVVDRWRAAAALTPRAVKAVLRGPWTSAWRGGEGAVLAEADRLHEVVSALGDAGCPLVEVEESEAGAIGADALARRTFRDAHVRLATARDGLHLSLSIVGGSAWEAGAETILDPPYRSLAVDLIAGPDNWNLVTRTPGERGIVVGALDPSRREGPELLVWAAHYAASTRGRGLARVGLGTGGSLAGLSWETALERMAALGEGARIAALPQGELAEAIDPRAVSSRAAATGRTRSAERRARSAKQPPPR